MPRFAIVIPSYNRRPLLFKALESVWSQTLSDYEVIVVDDGSTDDTWHSLQSQGGRLHALRQSNAGAGAARNLGAKGSKAEYFVFLDSDDRLAPWALEVFDKALQQHPGAAHMIGNAQNIRSPEDFNIAGLISQRYEEEFSVDFLACSPKNRIWASGFAAIKREYFEFVGGFDERLRCHEDQDMSLRLACAPGFVRVLSPPTVFINQTEGSLSRGDIGVIFDGILSVVNREQVGAYPGGRGRQAERRAYLSVNARNQSLLFARRSSIWFASVLYLKTFVWHIRLRRWRYLLGFPWAVVRIQVERVAAFGRGGL